MALTLAAVKAAVETDLDDAIVKRLLDAAVSAVDRSAGKATTESETYDASGLEYLPLSRRHTAIGSIVERRRASSDPVTLSADDYREVGDYQLLRLASGTNPASIWGREVVITYTPEVDQEVRDRVAIDLVKVDLEFKVYDKEKVGDWEGDQKSWKSRRRELLTHVREGRSPIL
jgi:hypothetical protein